MAFAGEPRSSAASLRRSASARSPATRARVRSALARDAARERFAMRSRSVAEKIELTARFQRELWPALDSGALSPVVHQAFPLAEVAAAHAVMEQNLNGGKIVLQVS